VPSVHALHDEAAATERLIRFLSVEGVTGHEKAISAEVVRSLQEAGVPRRTLRFDTANQHIPLPTETGNLIVTLPGTRPGRPRLFLAHLDTVPLAAGARPVRSGRFIRPAGPTALGGDDRTGVAVLVTLAATLLQKQLAHGPLTLLFTVREESGLWGARHADQKDLGEPECAFNVDGGSPDELTVGAVGAERWQAWVHGRAAHAGAHPEKGISATLVAALALAEIKRGGWFGKVERTEGVGTSNVGSFGGHDGRSAGNAANVVTDYVHLHGESRSHNPRFVRLITRAYKQALTDAAKQVVDDQGRAARVRFEARLDYHPFRLRPTAGVVRFAQTVAARIGRQPVLRVTNGGLDANWLVRNGIPTVTFGAGQREIHTIKEFVDLADFQAACRLAIALATSE
jgi:tripeptide aminopeptidase